MGHIFGFEVIRQVVFEIWTYVILGLGVGISKTKHGGDQSKADGFRTNLTTIQYELMLYCVDGWGSQRQKKLFAKT